MEQTELILQGIVEYCKPLLVILYGEKRSVTHQLKSLDFCIILPDESDKMAVQRKLYLSMDMEIPFNVLLYTVSEWDDLCADYTSYAAFIRRKGTVLYEQKP